jgi:hypothetical protein
MHPGNERGANGNFDPVVHGFIFIDQQNLGIRPEANSWRLADGALADWISSLINF